MRNGPIYRWAIKPWPLLLGIRGRLVLLVLALGVPFAIYLAFSTARQSVVEREHARQDMLSVAQLTAARLDDHVSTMAQLLVTLSHMVGTRVEDTQRNDTLLRSLTPHLPAYLNNMTVWTRSGENIGSFDPGLRTQPISIVDRKYFRAALQARGLVADAPIISRSNGEAIVVFAFPILRDGNVVGVVAASTRIKPLQALLDPKGSLPRGAVVTVVDADGAILTRSLDPDQWIGKRIPVNQEVLAGNFSRGTGVSEASSLDGVHRIFGFSITQNVPWLVYVGVPSDTALAPVQARLYENLALGGAMLLVGLMLAGWVAEQISRPLRELSADAATLGQGVLNHRSRVAASGEIGLMAATLNRMAEALQERAASLRRSEARLQQVTDNLPALVAHLDLDQRFRFANRAYRDWLGVDPKTLLGLSLRELLGDAAYAHLAPRVKVAIRGISVVHEGEMATLKGNRYVHVTLVPQCDPLGIVEGLYVMTHDITERREAELRRARSEERLSLALEGSGQALFDWDIRANRIYYSAQASVMRGGPAIETHTTPAEMRRFVHPDDIDAVLLRQREAIKGKTPRYDAEFRVRTESGDWIWIRSRGRAVERDANGRALRLAGTDADISQRKATEDRLRHLAEFDTLTGLPNRALFHDRLQQALIRAARNRIPVTLLFLDIDHFKRVNDTLGHEAGDDLLKAFARRLTTPLRQSDTVSRLAGDEFTVILEGVRNTVDARAIAHKLVMAGRGPVGLAAHDVDVTTSVGMARSRVGETDGGALLRRADAALYEAKRCGRDGYYYFDTDEGDQVAAVTASE